MQQSQETDIRVLGGIRTCNPSSERPQTHALDRGATESGDSEIIIDGKVNSVMNLINAVTL
jgi:hypothetical protein